MHIEWPDKTAPVRLSVWLLRRCRTINQFAVYCHTLWSVVSILPGVISQWQSEDPFTLKLVKFVLAAIALIIYWFLLSRALDRRTISLLVLAILNVVVVALGSGFVYFLVLGAFPGESGKAPASGYGVFLHLMLPILLFAVLITLSSTAAIAYLLLWRLRRIVRQTCKKLFAFARKTTKRPG